MARIPLAKTWWGWFDQLELWQLGALIVALFVALMSFVIWQISASEQQMIKDYNQCSGPLVTVRYVADPISKTCGLRIQRAILPVPCQSVLTQPDFAGGAHCWGESR